MNPNVGGFYWAKFIDLFDFVLLPVYLLVVYAIAYSIRNKNYSHRHPWRKYFIVGFSLKIFGAIFIGLIYQYYYRGGDTSAFFYHGKVINQSFSDSIVKWINLLFHIPDAYDIEYYKYINQMRWYGSPSSYIISAMTAVISLFTFNTYLPATILFAALSYSGTWALFRTFAEQYPKLVPQLALCILFIPSTFVWGSGIFKDTVCMTCLGWLTYAAFRMIIRKQLRWKYLFIASLCIYLLAVIKIYIVLVFLPALTIWLLNTYSGSIQNNLIKNTLRLSIYAGIGFVFLFFIISYSKELGQYSLENIAETSNTTRSYIYYVSTSGGGDEGSAYDLGNFTPTLTGMLTKFPLAVNVTLFRPYLWEARKPIIFLNAIEAFLFLFFTLKVIFSVGLKRIWKSIARSPNIQFCLVFTLIFAFAVGISSYNFGALSRYRIPCLPFYAMALVLIYYDNKSIRNKFFSFNFR